MTGTCQRCPNPATTYLAQARRTLRQWLLRQPHRTADVCHRHIYHALRYLRTGKWITFSIRSWSEE